MARRSRGEQPGPDTSIWLGDTMGELASWYAMAHVCFIGGTLVPVGGHNPLEAMALGKPVLFGPHTHNAEAVYAAAEQIGVGQRAESAAALLEAASQWLSDPCSPEGNWASRHRLLYRPSEGSSQTTVRALQSLWSPLHPRLLSAVAETRNGSTTVWHDPQWLTGMATTPCSSPLPRRHRPGHRQRTRTGTTTPAARPRCGAAPLPPRRSGRPVQPGPLPAHSGPQQPRHAGIQPAARHARAGPAGSGAGGCRQVLFGAPLHSGHHRRHDSGDPQCGATPARRRIDDPKSGRPLARPFAELHDAQIYHSDLNAHNILLDEAGKAWIVDFDKCEPPAW